MFHFLLLAATLLIPGVFNAPGDPELFQVNKRQGGMYWSNWSKGSGSRNCRNGNGGQYSVTWKGSTGGFVCGKGWRNGGSIVVKYSGTYTPTGPGYLAIYGWIRNPLIEYYVIESYDVLAPGEPWTLKGNFTSEEGTYELYTSQRVKKPSIEGTRVFTQYWSVRKENRVGGTVTMKYHFDAWGKVEVGESVLYDFGDGGVCEWDEGDKWDV